VKNKEQEEASLGEGSSPKHDATPYMSAPPASQAPQVPSPKAALDAAIAAMEGCTKLPPLAPTLWESERDAAAQEELLSAVKLSASKSPEQVYYLDSEKAFYSAPVQSVAPEGSDIEGREKLSSRMLLEKSLASAGGLKQPTTRSESESPKSSKVILAPIGSSKEASDAVSGHSPQPPTNPNTNRPVQRACVGSLAASESPADSQR